MEQSRSDASEHQGHAKLLLTVAIPTGGTAPCGHPPPPIPPCVHMLHAADPSHSLVLWVLSWGYVPCPHFNASSHPNLVEPLDFSFLAATPHVLKCPSCRTLYFSFWISQSQPKLGTLASGASLHPWPLGETLSCPGPALLYLLPHRTLQ